jgi:hypothetical protein
MPTADEPPRDFADQAIREQLQSPANLRELLHEVLGDIADGFVCEQREVLPRDFPLEDWRHRESDLHFRIPYKTPAETGGLSQVCAVLATAVPRPGRQDACGTPDGRWGVARCVGLGEGG